MTPSEWLVSVWLTGSYTQQLSRCVLAACSVCEWTPPRGLPRCPRAIECVVQDGQSPRRPLLLEATGEHVPAQQLHHHLQVGVVSTLLISGEIRILSLSDEKCICPLFDNCDFSLDGIHPFAC